MPTAQDSQTSSAKTELLETIRIQVEKLQAECEILTQHYPRRGMRVITPHLEYYSNSVRMHAALSRCLNCGKVVFVEKMATSGEWLQSAQAWQSPFKHLGF